MRLQAFAIGAFMLAAPLAAAAQNVAWQRDSIQIPQSIRDEHRALHNALETAMKRPDGVGAAARSLAAVLHPHFVREEHVALPPLTALGPISRHEPVKCSATLIAKSDSLERELPKMLDEHRAIASATEKLRVAAAALGAQEWVQFATDLRRHALLEEEVYYPAAVLVGRLLRQCAK